MKTTTCPALPSQSREIRGVNPRMIRRVIPRMIRRVIPRMIPRMIPRELASVALLALVTAGCQLLQQDPARCEQSVATVRQALSFKDFESARKWRDYTWKVCDERAVVATLDKEILDGETALDAETKATAHAKQLAQQRINSAQSAWYAFDAAKEEQHTREVLDATRQSAKRLEEGLPPAFAQKIAEYNSAQYEKRLAGLGR